MLQNKKQIIVKLSAAVFWIAVWQLLSALVATELLLPSPISTLKAFINLLSQKTFYSGVFFSFLRIFLGLFLGVASGIVLGALSAVNKLCDALFTPIKNIIKTLPVASVIVLILLWIDKNYVPVMIAFLTVMPIIYTAIYSGIKTVDKDLTQMADFFKLKRTDKIRYVYVNEILPDFSASFTTALGFSFKSGVAAEVIATPTYSIGRGIVESKLYLETPNLFAWTIAVVIISIFIEKVIVKAVSRIIK